MFLILSLVCFIIAFIIVFLTIYLSLKHKNAKHPFIVLIVFLLFVVLGIFFLKVTLHNHDKYILSKNTTEYKVSSIAYLDPIPTTNQYYNLFEGKYRVCVDDKIELLNTSNTRLINSRAFIGLEIPLVYLKDEDIANPCLLKVEEYKKYFVIDERARLYDLRCFIGNLRAGDDFNSYITKEKNFIIDIS